MLLFVYWQCAWTLVCQMSFAFDKLLWGIWFYHEVAQLQTLWWAPERLREIAQKYFHKSDENKTIRPERSEEYQNQTQQALHIVYTSSQYALAFKPSEHGASGVHFEKWHPEAHRLVRGFCPPKTPLEKWKKKWYNIQWKWANTKILEVCLWM